MDRPSKRVKVVRNGDDLEDGTTRVSETEQNGGTRRRSVDGGVVPAKRDDDVKDDDDDDEDVSQDMYLETVDRSKLDFDQDVVCSVTLSRQNVYACLVCGKFFSGRSRSTPVFHHALYGDEVSPPHHVFMHLVTGRVYIVPDGYENRNPALWDVKAALDPRYTRASIDATLSRPTEKLARDHFGVIYRPGFVGTTESSQVWWGALILAFAHVTPIRDALLLSQHEPEQQQVTQGISDGRQD